jgi:lipopolysaccharide transport system ATP-binding protein
VGPTTDAVSLYLQNSLRSKTTTSWVAEEAPGNEFIRLLKAWIQRPSKGDNEHVFRTNDALEVCVEFENLMAGDNVLDLTIHLQDERNILVFVTGSGVQGSRLLSMGKYRATCIIPGDLLNQGTYTISRLLFVRNRGQVVFEHHDTLTFEIIMPQASQFGWMGRKEGVVRPLLDWSLSEIE